MGRHSHRRRPGPETPGRPNLSSWLELRRSADEAAREHSSGLLRGLTDHFESTRGGPAGHSAAAPLSVMDLGAGTGANRAWLAPRLPQPQRWTLIDRDAALLDEVADDANTRTLAADISVLEMLLPEAPHPRLVTASALLDVLSGEQIRGLCAVLGSTRTPALFSLTVTGQLHCDPGDPDDEALSDAFNDHQSRDLLAGPTAPRLTVDALRAAGFTTATSEAPWRLGPGDEQLIQRYLTERIAVIEAHEPSLAETARAWLRRRLEQLDHGVLTLVVAHLDVLAIPQEHDDAPATAAVGRHGDAVLPSR